MISIFLCNLLVWNLVDPSAQAQAGGIDLPVPGAMIAASASFEAPVLRGLKVDPKNPFRLEFILDPGTEPSAGIQDEHLRSGAERAIRYFLASLTIPEQDLWVNLSPHEKDRIIPDAFGLTEMGRDLLAQDYILKQLTASLVYPESGMGKRFWSRVYEEAFKTYGTTDIPIDSFNKVWIVPDTAVVYEGQGTAIVTGSHLKVMLETDYLALEKQGILEAREEGSHKSMPEDPGSGLARRVIHEIILPALEKEVNGGKNFSSLRQVYGALILATWYKQKVTGSLLSRGYIDRNKVAGVNIEDPGEPEKIWGRYVEAFRTGVFNLIKEEKDVFADELITRKYFSGGMAFGSHFALSRKLEVRPAAGLLDNAMAFNRRRFFKMVVGCTLAAAVDTFSARATVKTPPNVNKQKYTARAAEIYGDFQKVLSEQSGIEIITMVPMGRQMIRQDVIGGLLKKAQENLGKALAQGGDAEFLYKTVSVLTMAANRFDAKGLDPRLQKVNKALKDMQRIYLLDEKTYDPKKPTILFIQGAGVGPFPHFNTMFDEMGKDCNVAFIVFDFMRPIEDLARLVNASVADFEKERKARIAGYVPLSYGFSVFVKAMMQDRNNMYKDAHVVAVSPMIGGSRKFKVLDWVDPTRVVDLFFKQDIHLARWVAMNVLPSMKNFLTAVNPSGKSQQGINMFLEQELRGRIKGIHVLLPSYDNHLDYSHAFYQELSAAGLAHTVVGTTAFDQADQHSFLPGMPETSQMLKRFLFDKAMDTAKGGIDLNPDRLGLSSEGPGRGAVLDFTDRDLERLSLAAGLIPVIISMTSMGDIAEFLGLAPSNAALTR